MSLHSSSINSITPPNSHDNNSTQVVASVDPTDAVPFHRSSGSEGYPFQCQRLAQCQSAIIRDQNELALVRKRLVDFRNVYILRKNGYPLLACNLMVLGNVYSIKQHLSVCTTAWYLYKNISTNVLECICI